MSYIRDLTLYLLPACAGLRTWQLYRPGAIARHRNFSWRRYDIETIFVLLCIYYKKPTVTSGPSNVDLHVSLLLAYKAVEQTSLCVVIVLHIPDPASCQVMWVKVILLNALSPVASHCYSSYSSHSRELFVNTFEAHDDVIKWKHFPRYWPFVRGIHRSPVNSAHKGQWRGALMFTLICARINDWVNIGEAGDLRRNRAYYDVIVMIRTTVTIKLTTYDKRSLSSMKKNFNYLHHLVLFSRNK